MRSLSGQNIPNTDKSNPTDYPYDRAKDAAQNANDGTPLLESTTITDVSYAFYHLMERANIQPDENPENINISQVFDAMMRLFGDVGSIVFYQGEAPAGSRLLLMRGQVINLAEPKYKYLKEWVLQTKNTYSGELFLEEGVYNSLRYQNARSAFRVKASDENFLRLPDVPHDSSPRMTNESKYMGIYTEGDVGKHTHYVAGPINIPAHTHAVTDNGHVHDRGTYDIFGKVKDVNCVEAKPNETEGAFYGENVRHTGPVNSYSNRTSDIVFRASRNWTGYSGKSYTGISINAAAQTTGRIGLTTNENSQSSDTTKKNLPAGMYVRPYLKY